jgi:hypothetical protein
MGWVTMYQWAAAASAFAASGFWLWSALIRVPGVPWGGSGGAYSQTLRRNAIANATAALLSGLSAFFAGVSIVAAGL